MGLPPLSLALIFVATFLITCNGEDTSEETGEATPETEVEQTPETKNNDDFMVDLTLMVDLAVRYGPPLASGGRQPSTDAIVDMSAWIASLFSNWTEADFQKLHLAIVDATNPEKLEVKFHPDEQGFMAPLGASESLSRMFDGKTFSSLDPEADVKTMVENVNKMLYVTAKGDRPYVPNVNVYIGTVRYSTRDSLASAIRGTINLFNAADIVVLADGWSRQVVTVHKMPDGTFSTPSPYEVNAPESKEAFKTAVESLLGRCPTYTAIKTICSYREEIEKSCNRTDFYSGNLADLSDVDGMKYCVSGSGTIEECDDEKCKQICDKHIKWSDCDCVTKSRTRSLLVNNLIEHCSYYTETSIACAPLELSNDCPHDDHDGHHHHHQPPRPTPRRKAASRNTR